MRPNIFTSILLNYSTVFFKISKQFESIWNWFNFKKLALESEIYFFSLKMKNFCNRYTYRKFKCVYCNASCFVRQSHKLMEHTSALIASNICSMIYCLIPIHVRMNIPYRTILDLQYRRRMCDSFKNVDQCSSGGIQIVNAILFDERGN